MRGVENVRWAYNKTMTEECRKTSSAEGTFPGKGEKKHLKKSWRRDIV